MSTIKISSTPSPHRERVRTGNVVRRRATVRRVDPWSVMKLSLIFNFFSLLIAMLAMYVLWTVIDNLSILDTITNMLDELRLTLVIHMGNVARAFFLIGLLNMVLWTGIHVFMAFLYNLIADLLGGFRVELASEE